MRSIKTTEVSRYVRGVCSSLVEQVLLLSPIRYSSIYRARESPLLSANSHAFLFAEWNKFFIPHTVHRVLWIARDHSNRREYDNQLYKARVQRNMHSKRYCSLDSIAETDWLNSCKAINQVRLCNTRMRCEFTRLAHDGRNFVEMYIYPWFRYSQVSQADDSLIVWKRKCKLAHVSTPNSLSSSVYYGDWGTIW